MRLADPAVGKGHAVVVGASSGIGEALGMELRARGFVVSGLSRRPSPPASADASFSCDVEIAGSVERALRESNAALGAPDLLVYASGDAVMGPTLEVPEDRARRCFEVNFWGMDRTIRAVLPAMCARQRGAILVVLSLAALRGIPFEAYYAASKAAGARYLDSLAFEAAASNVRVRYVCPGYIDTGFFERSWVAMPPPVHRGSGVSPRDVARYGLQLLDNPWESPVVGWRERLIHTTDRFAPGLYDRWLRFRGGRQKSG